MLSNLRRGVGAETKECPHEVLLKEFSGDLMHHMLAKRDVCLTFGESLSFLQLRFNQLHQFLSALSRLLVLEDTSEAVAARIFDFCVSLIKELKYNGGHELLELGHIEQVDYPGQVPYQLNVFSPQTLVTADILYQNHQPLEQV